MILFESGIGYSPRDHDDGYHQHLTGGVPSVPPDHATAPLLSAVFPYQESQVLAWGQGDTSMPLKQQYLHQLSEEQAKLYPDAIVLLDNEGRSKMT